MVVITDQKVPERIMQITTNNGGVFVLTNYDRIYFKSTYADTWQLVPGINFEELNK